MSNQKNTDSVNWAAFRQAAGFTLAAAAAASGYSVATINGLELKNEGSKRLRSRLLQLYSGKESNEPKSPVVADESTQSEVEFWRKRALKAEEKLQELRKVLESCLKNI